MTDKEISIVANEPTIPTIYSGDPDLPKAMDADQQKALVRGRLNEFASRLYQELLNLALLEATDGTPDGIEKQKAAIEGLRKAVRLHQRELGETASGR